MNFRTTLFLLVLLIGVGLYVLFTRQTSTDTRKVNPSESKLVGIEARDIDKVAITPQDGKRVVLERSGAAWRLAEPVNGAADSMQVDSLLREIADLASARQVDLKETGVESPSFRIEITDRNGKTRKLDVGNRATVGDNLYVRLDGRDKAEVVAAGIYEQLEKPYTTYRESRLIDVPQMLVTEVQITRPEGILKLRKEGSNWQIIEPKAMPADAMAVSDLLTTITSFSANSFVAEDMKEAREYQLDRPTMTIAFSIEPLATQPLTAASTGPTRPTTRGAQTVIRFGRYEDITKKNVFAAVSDQGPVVTVSATTLDSFRKTPLDLREKKVLDIDPEHVSELSLLSDRPAATQPITRPAERHETIIRRRIESAIAGPPMPATQPATAPSTAPTTQLSGTQPSTNPSTAAVTQPAAPPSKWMLVSEPRGDANETRMDALLQSLHPLKAQKFLEKSPTTQPAKTWLLRIHSEPAGGKPAGAIELHLSDLGPDSPPVATYGDLVFEVDRNLLDNLAADFAAASEPPAFPPPAAPRSPRFPRTPPRR